MHRVLAIDPTGTALRHLIGDHTTEPTFGLPAKWLLTGDRSRAEAAGCTVVDTPAVIATHLTELLRRNAHELLGRREAQELLDIAGKHNAKVVEELIPHLLSMGAVMQVLRNPARLLVTKIDEVDVPADLATLPTRIGLPITWITTGQAVPEDIEEPTPARLIELASTVSLHTRVA